LLGLKALQPENRRGLPLVEFPNFSPDDCSSITVFKPQAFFHIIASSRFQPNTTSAINVYPATFYKLKKSKTFNLK
jgi:hypothetical protein